MTVNLPTIQSSAGAEPIKATPVILVDESGNAASSGGGSTDVSALATQTTLAAVLAKLTSDPATQTTLAAVLAKIIAAPATEAKQDSNITQVTAAAAALGVSSGAAVITDATGTVQQYLRGLIKQWIAGTLTLAALPAGTNLIGKTKSRFFVSAGVTTTRPANQTPYAANDGVSNNATAGSVTPIAMTLSDTNDDTITVDRIRISTTDTGAQGKNFRIWLFNAAITAGTGDNVAFSQPVANFVGTMSGTFRTFSDGAVAICVPDEGSRVISLPTSGAKTLYALLQTLDIFTSSASSTTFTLVAEGFQGAA